MKSVTVCLLLRREVQHMRSPRSVGTPSRGAARAHRTAAEAVQIYERAMAEMALLETSQVSLARKLKIGDLLEIDWDSLTSIRHKEA